MAAQYNLVSATKSGTYLAEVPFQDLQGEFFYNKPDEIRFSIHEQTLNALTKNAFYPALTEVILYRNDVKVFCGPLWSVSMSKDSGKVSCVAGDISSYFDVRLVVGTSYSGTYANIAWQMIQETQSKTNGNLFITRGTNPGGGAPSDTVLPKVGTYMSDQFADFSDLALGFDWNITPDRVYHQYWPRVSTPSNVRLEFGGAVRTYGITYDGRYHANEVKSIGKNDSISSTVVDSTARAKYGLQEFVGSNTALSTLTALDSFNAGILEDRKAPRVDISISLAMDSVNPLAGDIKFGDNIPVVIDDGYHQVNSLMYCTGYQLTLGPQTEETFVVYTKKIGDL